MKLESKHKQEDTKDQGVGTDPQCQDHCADKRLDNQQDAEDKRSYAAQCEPPATVIDIKGQGRAQHQCAGNHCPNGNDPHECNECNRRPDNGEDTGGKINDAFKNEQAPLLAAAGRAYARDDRKDAINEHVSREDDDERPDGDAWSKQADQSEDDAQDAPQTYGPPVLSKQLAQCIGSGWIKLEQTSLFGCSSCHDCLLWDLR